MDHDNPRLAALEQQLDAALAADEYDLARQVRAQLQRAVDAERMRPAVEARARAGYGAHLLQAGMALVPEAERAGLQARLEAFEFATPEDFLAAAVQVADQVNRKRAESELAARLQQTTPPTASAPAPTTPPPRQDTDTLGLIAAGLVEGGGDSEFED